MGTIRWWAVERFSENKVAPDMLVHFRRVSKSSLEVGLLREGWLWEGRQRSAPGLQCTPQRGRTEWDLQLGPKSSDPGFLISPDSGRAGPRAREGVLI